MLGGGATPVPAAAAEEAPSEAAAQPEAAAQETESVAQTDSAAETEVGSTTRLSEVKVEVIKEGKGKLCKDSDIATMDYVGTLYKDDTEFDKGNGFEFTVGGY